MVTSADQSWGGLYRSLAREPNVAVRPPQIVWYIVFHKVSPGDTQAAHLASHALFGLAVVALYTSLRRMPATREGTFGIVLLYVCAPHFVAVRMWYAAHQAVLALLFFTVTLLLVAIYANGEKAPRRHWLVLPILLCAAASSLSYEMFAFVLLGVPVFVWRARGAPWMELVRDRAFQLALLATIVPVAATSAYKISFAYAFSLPQSGSGLADFTLKVAAMYVRLAMTEFGAAGVLVPRAVIGIATGPYFDPRALAAVAICAAVLVLYGWRCWRPAEPPDAEAHPARTGWLLAVSGMAVFALAYVPLVANFYYNTMPFGEGSRIHIAGAIGVALVFYAALRAIERKWRGLGAALLAIFCLCGVFIQVSIGRMWAEASAEQDRRYAILNRAAGELSEVRTVLLYGACPYHGAAPVDTQAGACPGA